MSLAVESVGERCDEDPVDDDVTLYTAITAEQLVSQILASHESGIGHRTAHGCARMRGPSKLQGANAMNPYLDPVGRRWLRAGRHGDARALQGLLALNLDNGREWPVDMGQVCGLSDEHPDAALSMRMDHRILGEQNEAFRALCREIATERLGQPQADGD